MSLENISSDWKGSTRFERRFIQRLIEREGTGRAIVYFSQHCDRLDNYWYWFVLGTLWVNYSGWSDLDLWKRLFSSKRPNRETSLMKPNELIAFRRLPETVRAYRAHRSNECDWIAYTLDPKIAARFAAERGVDRVTEYAIPKAEILALFLRRGEVEILVINKTKACRLDVIQYDRYAVHSGKVVPVKYGTQAQDAQTGEVTPVLERYEG